MYGSYCDNNNEDMEPIRTWILKKNGKMVYSSTQKLTQELEKSPCMIEIYGVLRAKGNLKIIKTDTVDQMEQELLKDNILKSNDGHIIALAQAAKATQVANVRLLVSADKALHADFKKIVGGHIYQNKTHARLLTADTCP